jgi:hypothetical protein
MKIRIGQASRLFVADAEYALIQIKAILDARSLAAILI